MNRKDRHTTVLVVVLVALGALSLGARLLEARRGGGDDSALPLFRDLRAADVVHLRVEGPDGLVIDLDRDGERWWLDRAGDVLADADAVAAALQKLVDLPRGRVVQPTATGLEGFDLEGPRALRVTAQDAAGGVLADLVIGGFLDGATFVLDPAEQAVRRVDTNARHRFERPGAGGWRDRSVTHGIDRARVTRLTVRGPVWEMILERPADGGEWTMVAPQSGAVQQAQVDPLLRHVTALQARSFYDGPLDLAELGLAGPPAWTITAAGVDGPLATLWLGDRSVGQDYPVRRPDQEPTWLIAGFIADFLRREPRLYLRRGG